MPEMVTITVDDETIETEEGTSVLTAALDAGICIPNLCYIPETRPPERVAFAWSRLKRTVAGK